MNKLSHSSASIFQECPTKWKFHYIKKLRPKHPSGALLFGSAIDSMSQELFNPNGQPEKALLVKWSNQEVNKVITSLKGNPNIAYAESDFDYDLLEEADLDLLQKEFEITDVKEKMDEIYKSKKNLGFNGLPEKTRIIYSTANWLSMYRKGILMIGAIKKDFLPLVEHVYSVQEKAELSNGEDSIVMFSDVVVKLKGYDKPVVIDFKTSSIVYEKNFVLTSPQLTLYVHCLSEKYENTRLAGVFVLNKHIKHNKTKICSLCGKDGTGQRHRTCDNMVNYKRCNGEWNTTDKPEIFTQLLVDEIPLQTEEIVIENFDNINESINNAIFHRNLNSCHKPWGKCSFFDLCYYGKMDDLVEVK